MLETARPGACQKAESSFFVIREPGSAGCPCGGAPALETRFVEATCPMPPPLYAVRVVLRRLDSSCLFPVYRNTAPR